MTTTGRTRRPTIEQLVADAKAVVFDDRLDACVPPELFGPPTEAERKADAAARTSGSRPNGTHAKGAPARNRTRDKAPRQ